MNLRSGKKPGTIVAEYEPGEERQYMIDVYGGRLVAEGVSKADMERIIEAVNKENIDVGK